MRELIVTQNITLDGVIDAAEGWFGPRGECEVDESDVIEAVAEQVRAAMRCSSGVLDSKTR